MPRGLPLTGWMRRLWWFDVVYPIAVALLIFSSLTYIVYGGQRSSRLSLLAEQKLLELSLTLGAGRPPEAKGDVLVVSADALDVKRLGRAPLGVAPEPDAATFAAVVDALVRRGVRTIFIRWHMDAHPSDDAYYAPLVQALRRLPEGVAVRFATSSAMLKATPSAFQAVAKVVEDETCNYPERLHSDCPFNPDWPDWVMQAILDEALPAAAQGFQSDTGPLPEAQPAWLTLQMPSIAPSYLLNLPAPAALSRASFASLLAEDAAGAGRAAKVAFVGTDLSHGIARTNASSVLRFVRTVYDEPGLDFSVAGTPLHVFWAMTSQMLHDRAMVAVPAEVAILAMTVAFCGMVIFVMARFGGTAASGMFLVYVGSGPVLNAWAIPQLNVYAPLFDSFYFGLSTFIVAGFGRLSFTAFHRWRLTEQRRMHAHTADLKGNFISLLSHNLNTPVAKMQGMLGLLLATPGDSRLRADVRRAEFHVTQLEYAIRSVLVASALEEGSLAPQARSLRALLDELDSVYGASLRRLGLTLTASLEGDADLGHVPLDFDVRAVTAAVAGLAALFAREASSARVALTARVEEDADGRRRLELELASDEVQLEGSAKRILERGAHGTVRSLAGPTFFTDVLAGLGVLTAVAHGGHIAALERGVRLWLWEAPSRLKPGA